MISFIKKYQITIFCLFNLFITFFLIVVLDSDYIPQWMPGISALLLIGIVSGRIGFTGVVKRLQPQSANSKWYMLSLLIPVLVLFATYLIMNCIGQKAPFSISLSSSYREYSLAFVFILIGSLGEEIGWRGFLLPSLLNKYSFLKSSVIIGVVWGLWHFRFDSGAGTFFVYILFAVETSIILSWLYYKTKGSIIPVIIYHTAINMCGVLLFEELLDTNQEYSQLLFFGICTLICAIPCYYIVRSKKLEI